MQITRRMVLATAAGVAAAGAVGGGGMALRWWDRAPGTGRRALSEDEYAFAQALAEAWMPPGGDPPLSGADADLGAFLDEVVASMAPGTGRELKLLMQILDDATLPTHLSAFRHLPRTERTEVVRGWLHSDIALQRAAMQGVLVLLAEGWTTHPAVVPSLRPYFPCGYGR